MREYEIGQIVNGRTIIGYKAPHYICKCPYCNSESKVACSGIEHQNCRCLNHTKRFSGKFYINSPERIAELKEKYKNGVTDEILNEFMTSLGGSDVCMG